MLSLILTIVLGTAPEALGSPTVMNLRRLDGSKTLCVARQVITGPSNRVGKWVYSGPYVPPTTDRYGFGTILNNFRSRLGLRSVRYDQNLSNWASQNNQAQCSRGLGHYVNPNCYQNSGWNYANAQSVMNGWIGSPGHYETLVSNTTSYGIAYGPGPYWTLNMR